MKEMKNKIVRYTTAVGALLAVAPAANAAPLRGTLIPGDDGNTTLTEDMDFVGIDMDNDTNPDFYAVMYSTIDTSTGPFGATFVKGVLLFANTGNYVEMPTSATMTFSTGTSFLFISGVKKFLPGNEIGPLVNPDDIGLLAFYSNGTVVLPAPPTSPFGLGQTGFAGVSMPGPSGNYYGWIQITVEPNSDVEIIDCALQKSLNTPIVAGDTVPLLPIASALGMGLIGLAAYAKRRKKKETI